jgi:peptide/nickel transport system permease protein
MSAAAAVLSRDRRDGAFGFARRLGRHRFGMIGLVILTSVVAMALLAPVLAPYDPLALRSAERLEAPSPSHLFGTDMFGRDVLSRVMWGARTSLLVASAAVGVACLLSLLIGLTAGFLGGLVDDVLMRAMDVFFAFPSLLLAIVLAAFLGPGVQNVVIAIAIVFTPPLSRVVRASVISVKGADYVEAARALGASDRRVVLRHVLLNSWNPLIIQASVYLAYAVLTEASLSFLGLGVQPPTPSWGEMLSSSRSIMQRAPWAAIFPGLMLSLTVLSINFLADGLRGALDPRQR